MDDSTASVGESSGAPASQVGDLDLGKMIAKGALNVTFASPEHEDVRRARIAQGGANHGEALRQRRLLFNSLLPALLVLFGVLLWQAMTASGETQKLAADLLKSLLPATLTFLIGRAVGPGTTDGGK